MMQLSDHVRAVHSDAGTKPEAFFDAAACAGLIEKRSRIRPDGIFDIPGLDVTLSFDKERNAPAHGRAFVPQGICEAGGFVLITAYDHEHVLNSVIYVLEGRSGRYITTLITNGRQHVGGIAYDAEREYVWVSNGYHVGGIALNAIELAVKEAGKGVKAFLIDYELNLRSPIWTSYLTFFGGMLWIGKYALLKSEEIYGLMVDYEKKELIKSCQMPAPAGAQGMAFFGRERIRLAITRSGGGFFNTRVSVYEPEQSMFSGTREFITARLNRPVRTFKYPPQGEGIAVTDRVYMLFESAAAPYRSKKGKMNARVDKYITIPAEKFFGIKPDAGKEK